MGMTKTLQAVFDGEVLRPEEPLDLEPNTRVRITIEADDGKRSPVRSFLQTARDLRLEGPTDWSSRIEDYLYGGKRDASR
jgi:predicted DNA-binding antitoxin AbrB/MazE fold protein